MRTRNVTKNWDWTFGQSQLNYTKDQKSVITDVQMRLKEWYYDCFTALQKGIPWSIRLGYHNQKDLLDRDVKNTVLNTNGVLNISDFESMVNSRRYRATMIIYTLYSGEGESFTFESGL